MRVAIHYDHAGNVTVYADAGVTVYSVSDVAPNDRVYRMTPAPIPEGMIDGPVGYLGDGSPAEARAIRAAADTIGKPHLRKI